MRYCRGHPERAKIALKIVAPVYVGGLLRPSRAGVPCPSRFDLGNWPGLCYLAPSGLESATTRSCRLPGVGRDHFHQRMRNLLRVFFRKVGKGNTVNVCVSCQTALGTLTRE